MGPLTDVRAHQWVDTPPSSGFSVESYEAHTPMDLGVAIHDSVFYPHDVCRSQLAMVKFYRGSGPLSSSDHGGPKHTIDRSATSRVMVMVITGSKHTEVSPRTLLDFLFLIQLNITFFYMLRVEE
jgi:hypothetical protein